MPATTTATVTSCANCGTALQGAYCHSCGEKRLGYHDYALGHFLEHAVDTTTHFDFKVLKGMWSLLARPGRMTADILRGRRVPWPKPLQLFLIANLLFVFVAHRIGLKIFNTPLNYHLDNWYGRWALEQINNLTIRRKTSAAQLTEQFNHLADVLSKSLIFVFIPLVALALAALLWRRRRYYLEHVVTATHYMSLLLLLQLLMVGPVLLLLQAAPYVLGRPLTYSESDQTIGVLMLLALTGWGYGLLRRTYGGGRWLPLLQALGLSLVFAWLLISVYRPFLFLVTYLLL
ncbi:DUF3667 domain-containing protein [Hymenobacter latericus]|uniref:DUF3667 domain-containing protein n=1 Tax=Hymenobacter sp. YIM 151858-1 TaxID=2987688 RepID=UPI0022278C2D|nr:DUF3667 domain-containing protein [Hymenobacter sp. YIM 151858-1]UYZ60887.1 DUF3667 domain-containing protein [Hymenobacter sp. YIM 151858-1]